MQPIKEYRNAQRINEPKPKPIISTKEIMNIRTLEYVILALVALLIVILI